MIIYVPRLIESAEQAEALPLNTLAISADGVDPAIRKEDGWHGIFGDPPYSHSEMVSDYALVPIEAEEERKGVPTFPRPDDAPWPAGATPNLGFDGRWYYVDEDGYSTAHLGGHPFHDLMVAWIDSLPRTTRYTTPWEPQQ